MEDKKFIYVRGMPGVGKITVARILKDKTGFNLYWHHDIKNAVQRVVEKYRIPRLMDKVQIPIVKDLLEDNKFIIYVRPSPDIKTVNSVKKLIKKYSNYSFYLFTLVADRETLEKRVKSRKDPYRICTTEEFDDYFTNKPKFRKVKNDFWIDTSNLKPEEIADIIINQINKQS